MTIPGNKIWNEIIDGNKETLSQVFISLYDDIFRYAKRFEHNEDAVKDIIQDLFTSLWVNREKLCSVDNIKAYLYKSMRNLIINNKNNKHYKTDRLEVNEYDFLFTSNDFIETEISQTNRKEELILAINNLPAKQKEVIYLKYFQGFDSQEIADILNQNSQSVRNSLHRAISNLRKNFLFEIFISMI